MSNNLMYCVVFTITAAFLAWLGYLESDENIANALTVMFFAGVSAGMAMFAYCEWKRFG